MKEALNRFLNIFFSKDFELRVKLFHVLAIAGSIISVIMAVLSFLTGSTENIFTNILIAAVSILLLLYSVKSRKYQRCYVISIIVIFFIAFPAMYFKGGGFKSGMPFFFIFAIVFTVYMLDGVKTFIFATAEILFYIGLFIYAYIHPEMITYFADEQTALVDAITGFIVVSIALGATLMLQIRMYRKQQIVLEKATAEAENASNAKSAFLANMSHEIRTPIHIILGMNEIIKRENQNIQVGKCSDKIDEAGKMLLSLVDNVLDVSKIESGNMELFEDNYETDELVQMIVLIGRTRCDKKGLKFSIETDDNLPEMLFGDVMRIKQIAVNILSNATKYTESGSVSVKISCSDSEKADETILTLVVTDTGIGIPDDAVPTLFNAFNRVDEEAHKYIEGTGLGLSIVKTLIELMGGKIRLESELGKGTSFCIEIPQKKVSEDEAKQSDEIQTFVAPECHILIVDDNEGNRDVLRALLSDTKILMDMAGSGQECIDLVALNSYDLILMDYMMPEMDGIETLKRLKKNPDFDVPVVALTADAVAGTEDKLLSEGFTAFLSKPVPWMRLRNMLMHYLPEEKVTVVSVKNTHMQYSENIEKIRDKVLPYGIVLEKALEMFHDDLQKCGITAGLFLKYDAGDRNKARALFEKRDYESLRFMIHALKGKAKNMGMYRLYEISANVEQLCMNGEYEEAESLMPHLFFLWKKGGEGLGVLFRETAVGSEFKNEISVKESIERLPELLKQLRRKPSLDCLNVLLKNEENENKKSVLTETIGFVTDFKFEEAEKSFEKYIHFKEDKND